MNAIAKSQDHMPDNVVPASSLMEIISRAASDPKTDVDKLERLMAMAERLEAKNAKAAYLAALVKMKPDLPVVGRKGKIEVRKKGASGDRDGEVQQSTAFARWEDIDEAITPILAKHGFVLTFRCGAAADGKVTVTGVLGHSAGHTEETTMSLPHDSTGSKNAVQAVGSSTSYGKRYTASLLLNIRTKGEDDDGVKGGNPGTISEEQAERILELLTRDKADVPRFCKYMGVDSILEIPASKYSEAIEKINTRSQKVKEKAPTQ